MVELKKHSIGARSRTEGPLNIEEGSSAKIYLDKEMENLIKAQNKKKDEKILNLFEKDKIAFKDLPEHLRDRALAGTAGDTDSQTDSDIQQSSDSETNSSTSTNSGKESDSNSKSGSQSGSDEESGTDPNSGTPSGPGEEAGPNSGTPSGSDDESGPNSGTPSGSDEESGLEPNTGTPTGPDSGVAASKVGRGLEVESVIEKALIPEKAFNFIKFIFNILIDNLL